MQLRMGAMLGRVPKYTLARADLQLQDVADRFGLQKRYFDLREQLRARLDRLPLDPYRDQGVLFIHVPKCGGSSIEQQLGVLHGHRSAVYFRHADPELFARLYKVALVRNPYDRLVSGFHWMKNHTRGKRDRAWTRDTLAGIDDFEAFAEALGNRAFRQHILRWVHFVPQWYYLCDPKGRILVDHVGRLENFETFAGTLGDRIGRTIANTRVRKSERGDYQSYYTEDSAAIVRDMYRRDFDLFGYSPDDLGRGRVE